MPIHKRIAINLLSRTGQKEPPLGLIGLREVYVDIKTLICEQVLDTSTKSRVGQKDPPSNKLFIGLKG